MKSNITFSRAKSLLMAAAMMFAGQSAWAQYVGLTALSGTGGTGGEGYASLVDGKTTTKMGHSFDPSNPDRKDAYIIAKTATAVVPTNYFLVTGGDTGSFPGRNWSDWTIYGANFDSDADATRDAAGWVVISQHVSEVLPTANAEGSTFQFNKADGTAYQYYRIEVTKSVQGSDTWLQMAEFGLGTYEDFVAFLNKETSLSEPINYKIIAGDRNNGDGEGLSSLFDNNYNTKWGNGLTQKKYGETTNGAYFIIRTSRSIAPTYYKLVTGTDNASWNHRNWKDWQIYAMADVTDESKLSRTSEGWVLLDKKDNISEEILPDKNSFEVFFNLSEENTTKYKYFKVEIDAIMSGGGYMQMTEFALGDSYTLQVDIKSSYDARNTIDYTAFAKKSLLDEYAALLEKLLAITEPADLGKVNSELGTKANEISASINKYDILMGAYKTAKAQLDDENLNAAATAYAEKLISESEVIAPCDEYPVGNYGYIKENRQLTDAEAEAEAARINTYLNANVSKVDDPIYATYEAIDGSGGFNDAESHQSLIDGDRENTKWCSNQIPGYVIFKSDSPIRPTYYGLVTGGDTHSYPDRNWKTWKIYAGDFESDEEATKDAEGWVLIDNKVNIGTDILKTDNKFESYINLSDAPTKAYTYFKIEVTAAGGGLMQMNEFTFYNQGNFVEYRQQFIDEFSGNTTEGIVANKELINKYNKAYEDLCNASSAPTLMSLKNELTSLWGQIEESQVKYEEYEEVFASFDEGLFADYEQASAWAEGYVNENVAPCAMYIRGTHDYIIENMSLDNEELAQEIAYLQNMMNAASEGFYVLLGGHTVGEWGDGFYGNLIDGNAKNYMDVDEEGNPVEVKATKWGGQPDANGDTYIIFRTIDKTNPFFYTLTTGNDTGTYQDRNWGTWYIYGANFDGDGDATKDAEGWELIDVKENIGKDRLHPVNAEESYFGFSTETTTEYMYYKIVVTKAFAGSAIQMNEIHFGTEEEFDMIKSDYTEEANSFDTDVIADQTLIDKYEATVGDIDECTNMEALFRINYNLAMLRDSIDASVKVYERFAKAVEANKAYLEENKLEASDALTLYENYLNEPVEAGDVYPNGSAVEILESHLLADSTVIAELDYMESLKAAAAAAGYVAGTDISSMIVNRSFAKSTETKDADGNKVYAPEGWDGVVFGNGSNEDGTMSAAEFCNHLAKFDVNQTLTGLKNGFYEVKLNAGFRPNGDITSVNYSALAYANDVKTYVPAVLEGMASEEESWLGNIADKEIYDIDEYNDTIGVKGYVIWGVLGSCNAFLNDRYEITMVAQVTDGNLTIGIKNDGTAKGGDWTSAGNFRLKYLGEAEDAEAVAAAVEYNAARANTMLETYEAEDASDAEFVDAPNFAAAQKAELSNIAAQASYAELVQDAALFEDINAAKLAYVKLNNGKNTVYDHWINHPVAESFEDDIYGIVDALNEGVYASAAEALAAKKELYAKYPAYLGINEEKPSNNADYVESMDAPFEYTISSTGVRPYVSISGIYEPTDTLAKYTLTFEYKLNKAVTDSKMFFAVPSVNNSKSMDITLDAAEEWTSVTIDITEAVKTWKYGTALDHYIRWDFTMGEEPIEISVRNILVNENGTAADINGDGVVSGADIQALLNIIASGEEVDADVNGDGVVSGADIQALLNIIAAQ